VPADLLRDQGSNVIELRSEHLTARIAPQGAELKSLRTAGGTELIWQADPAWWNFSAPFLFPVIGRLHDGRIRHGEAWLEIPPHGIARTATFSLVKHDATGCAWQLAALPEHRAVYPFDFRLLVTYRLDRASLAIEVVAENRGAEIMPAAIGFHPGFNWPMRGGDRAGHGLVFARDEPDATRRPDENGLLGARTQRLPQRGSRLDLADALFVDGAQVLDPVRSESVQYVDADGPLLTVRWRNCPQLGVWTKPGAPFICIEPWHGLADLAATRSDLAGKPGMAHVAPGSSLACGMTIDVGMT
jgi:galactose mutarotase-like enzyme